MQKYVEYFHLKYKSMYRQIDLMRIVKLV